MSRNSRSRVRKLRCRYERHQSRGIAAFKQKSAAVSCPRLAILSERGKTGKGRLLSVGDLRGIRIPEIEQKSAETASFSVSVAVPLSSLHNPGRLNNRMRFCYTARG